MLKNFRIRCFNFYGKFWYKVSFSTNIPLTETLHLCVQNLYRNQTYVGNLTQSSFYNLFKITMFESGFTFHFTFLLFQIKDHVKKFEIRLVVRCRSNYIFSSGHRQIHKKRGTQEKNKNKNKQKRDRLLYLLNQFIWFVMAVSPKNIVRIRLR